MHEGTKVTGIIILIATAIIFAGNISDPSPLTYPFVMIGGGMGIGFLIISKAIGVLEDIRDRLPAKKS